MSLILKKLFMDSFETYLDIHIGTRSNGDRFPNLKELISVIVYIMLYPDLDLAENNAIFALLILQITSQVVAVIWKLSYVFFERYGY